MSLSMGLLLRLLWMFCGRLKMRDFKLPPISNFELVRFIGGGVWKAVYQFRNAAGQHYAFKFFDLSDTAKEQLRERNLAMGDVFFKETLGGNSRSLPHVAVNGIGYADDGTPYLWEEYLDRFVSDFI